MTQNAGTPPGRHLNWKLIALIIISGGVLLLIVANTHLVYVAFKSQPDCVPHAKQVEGTGTYRAAQSAC